MAAIIDSWHPWVSHHMFSSAEIKPEHKLDKSDVGGRELEHEYFGTPICNKSSIDQFSQQTSSAIPTPPALTLTSSSVANAIENRVTFPPTPPGPNKHPFPSSMDTFPKSRSSLRSLNRTNKLYKSPTFSNPPKLAPLSFIEEPGFDLDLENFSKAKHDLSSTTDNTFTTSLLDEYVILPSENHDKPQKSRKLVKRRKRSLSPIPQSQIVSSSSGAAAAAAVTGNPSAPVAAPSQLASSPKAYRARSDVGHGLRSSLSLKRSSIIRRLSMRTPKQNSDSILHTPTSGGAMHSSGSIKRWPIWRSSASENGHSPPSTKKDQLYLPLVRISSPLSMSLCDQGSHENTSRITNPRVPPIKTNSSIHPSGSTDLLGSLDSPTSHLQRPRPKFTLEGNDSEGDLLTPPTPPSENTSPDIPFAPFTQSGPPSRATSTYDHHYLPLSYDLRTKQRWTFAMAMTDEGIPDEVIVEELERLRIRQEWGGSVDDIGKVWDAEQELFNSSQIETMSSMREPPGQVRLSYTPSLPSFPHQHRNTITPLDTDSTQQWQIARRALLTCRELVRTERHYLSSLRQLLAFETESSPPPLMLCYIEELANASENYLTQLEENPTVWGVAAAFLGSEEALDTAFVRWCGIVGTWFDGPQDWVKTTKEKDKNTSKKTSKAKLSEEYHKGKDKEDEIMSLIKTVNNWRKSMTAIPDASSPINSFRHRPSPPSFPAGFGKPQAQQIKKRKKPPVRELAILPTQRIMRYVLLYRDLLARTPSTSPTHAVIKRASDASLRIAQKCDRAQNNAAFILDSKSK